MAQHEWKTRDELESIFDSCGLTPLATAGFGCVLCGAQRNAGSSDELPASGCLDIEGGALPQDAT